MVVYFIIVSLGYMFGNFLSGRFAERAGIVRMVVIGQRHFHSRVSPS